MPPPAPAPAPRPVPAPAPRAAPAPAPAPKPASAPRPAPRPTPTPADLERMLRAASLRITRPRLAVLAAVHHHPHADTDAIINAARADLGGVSHQAVYDVLRVLTAAGLVRRFQPMGSVGRYEARVGDNHHHAVCRSCGAISDVDGAVGDARCLTAAAGSGYEIGETEVIYWGQCPTCISQAGETAREEPARQEKNGRV